MANNKPVYISFSPQEKRYCDLVLNGKPKAEAYRIAFKDEIEKLDKATSKIIRMSDDAIRQAAQRLSKREDIQEGIRWLTETPEQQQIQDVMRHQLMFGDKNDQMKAAEFLHEVKFASRDAAARWVELLQEIGADVVTECSDCGGAMRSHRLIGKGEK